MPKYSLGIDVLTAAQQRIEWTFDNFPRIYCSFSAGKDSGVMAHMVLTEARKRGRTVGLFFLDWECRKPKWGYGYKTIWPRATKKW